MKKVLLLGHIGRGNFGDDFMTLGFLTFLIDKYHDIKITCLSSEEILKSPQVSYEKESLKAIVFNICKSEQVIINGGNYLHDYSNNLKFKYSPFFKFLLVLIVTKTLRKRLSYVGQGFGPFKSLWANFLFKIIISNADYISAREKHSFNLANSVLTSKNKPKLHLTHDSTFYLSNSEVITNNTSPIRTPVLGLNLLKYYDIYEAAPSKDYPFFDKINFIVEKLAEEKFIDSRVVFTVFNNKLSESERDIYDYLNEKSKIQYKVLNFNSTTDFIKEFDRQIDFFIGMRLHGIILSKILDKPQFNFAYHPKCIHNWEYLELDPLGIIPMSNAEVTGVLEYLKTNIGKASFTNQKSNQSCTQNFQKTFFKW